MKNPVLLPIFRCALAVGSGLVAVLSTVAEPIQFNRDIRPILSDKCFTCHGQDANVRKADLRLDTREGFLAALGSGNHAVVPGDPGSSSLIARITTDDPDDRMPPASSLKQLSPEEVEKLTRWIQEGAVWEEHWAFQRVERPETPTVEHAAWLKNPIDSFVLKPLEEHNVAPSPEADRRTLIRRLFLDLTGLPPSIAEVEAFLADQQPDAYERLVDRLLESTEHAEHMTRYWLDGARYSDTNGYHIDNERYMWPWRDWVIRAFKENKPYDQFTVEQLAGDLLPNPTKDQQLVSGFNRNHMINFEGGIIPEEYRVQYVMDRVEATSTVWLGLTMTCAQCHDHKYDPVSQAEYYKLYAYFNNLDENGSDGRDGNAVPIIRASSDEQDARLAKFNEQIGQIIGAMHQPLPEIDGAQAAWENAAREKLQNKWQTIIPTAVLSTGGSTLTPGADGVITATGENPAKDVYELDFKLDQAGVTALKVELLPRPDAPLNSIGRSDNGNVVITEIEAEISPIADAPTYQRVGFVSADADYAQATLESPRLIDGNLETGYGAGGHESPGARSIVLVPEGPIGNAVGSLFKLRIRQESGFPAHAAERVRISITTDPTMGRARLEQWYIAGPYTAADGDVAYKTAYDPEKGIDLESTYEDGRQKWQLAVPGFEDGKTNSLSGRVAATYLYRKIVSPSARATTLAVGSNDAIKIWLNGQVVHDNNTKRGVTLDQDQVRVTLREGENELLLKVVNYGNAYAFAFRNMNEQVGEFSIGMESLLAKAPEARTEAETNQLRDHYRRANWGEWPALETQLAKVREEMATFEKELPTSMVMNEKAPRETFLLVRGSYDQYGEKVEPGVPAALPALPEGAPNNRLGFAQWLVDRDHPLMSRVTVNRFWQQYFGSGLVKTTEDFGSQGDLPTHPELLDWLSAEFMESGWDVRHIQRLIVTSATYRQSSKHRHDTSAFDAGNRLLAYAPRFRMDAEVVRDNALAVSGLLNRAVGGPSVRPYQPMGLWEEVAYGDGFTAQIFTLGPDDHLHRRSMYTFWKRTSPPPSMMLFDAPNRETCSVKRSRSNTPLQALALLNDPQFVEAARFLAERMMTEADNNLEARVNHAFQLTLSRPARPEEMAIFQRLYTSERAAFAAEPKRAEDLLKVGNFPANAELDPVELATWSTIASVILNMDETITKT